MRDPQSWVATKFSVSEAENLHVNYRSSSVSLGSVTSIELLASALGDLLTGRQFGDTLDLGCGSAPLYESYADRSRSITTVDWPAGVHFQQHVDVFADLATGVPLRSETVDTVILTDVLEHITTPEELVREAYRLLRPGGSLVFSAPFMYFAHEIPHDYFRYTTHAWRYLLSDAGFEVEVCRPVGGVAALVSYIGMKSLSRLCPEILEPAAKRFGWSMGRALGRLEKNREELCQLFVVGTARKPIPHNSNTAPI